jgi:FdhE protein
MSKHARDKAVPSPATPKKRPSKTAETPVVPKALISAITLLRGLEHVPAAQVDLFEKVALAQWRARRALKKGPYEPPAADTAAQMIAHGFYLIDYNRLELEPSGLQALWEELCAILAEVGDLNEAQATRLVQAPREGKLSLAELGGVVFRREREPLARLARRLRVSQGALELLGTLMLTPYVSAAAEELAGLLKESVTVPGSWPHPYCPVCGHEPFMAILRRPNGRREVECGLCATRWEVGRGACVFCGDEQREGANFLYYDLESPYRVNLCEKCRRYIKSVDERKMAGDREPVLLAEHIATLYLDALARRKRYAPPGPALPGGKPSGAKKEKP